MMYRTLSEMDLVSELSLALSNKENNKMFKDGL
mgnify:CR=1 FL=1